MTEKQRNATGRNWSIRRLRALYALCGQLDSDLKAQAEALIDKQLGRWKAEPETSRRIKKIYQEEKDWSERYQRKLGDLA